MGHMGAMQKCQARTQGGTSGAIRQRQIKPRMFQTTIDGQSRRGLHLPLCSLTVHKSQGMSITRLELDISKSWDSIHRVVTGSGPRWSLDQLIDIKLIKRS